MSTSTLEGIFAPHKFYFDSRASYEACKHPHCEDGMLSFQNKDKAFANMLKKN